MDFIYKSLHLRTPGSYLKVGSNNTLLVIEKNKARWCKKCGIGTNPIQKSWWHFFRLSNRYEFSSLDYFPTYFKKLVSHALAFGRRWKSFFRVRCRRRLEVLRVVSEIEKLWGLGFSNMPKIPNSAAVTSALLEFWPFLIF